MEFYLNKHSLPLIRRCINCIAYNQDTMLCSNILVSSAYDHNKLIELKVSDNLVCKQHQFEKEQELKETAIIVELNSVQQALDIIATKKEKDLKKKQLSGVNWDLKLPKI